MSQKTLRTLERDGFLVRTVTTSVPVRVDYELTELGERIQPLMGAITGFAEENITQVQESGAAFVDAPV